ncbi:MAG: hypothetical protein EXS46_00610 [Candidatus Taylorbacteria bacterium]|nr:hypothetical protein [Candidatus Taylorbacteria bacterium]
MKKILLQVPNSVYANNAIFGIDVNNMNEPWQKLKARLEELGYELVTADNHKLEDCEWILFIDSPSVDGLLPKNTIKSLIKKILRIRNRNSNWPTRALYREAIEKGLKDKMAMFLWEGQVNNPENYTDQVFEKFKYFFTWNDDLVDNIKFFKFFLPIPLRQTPTTLPTFHEKKLLINMSANRYYPRPNELYSARARTSAYFSSHYPKDFDLYGALWHTPRTRLQKYFPWLVPKFACYRGPAENKISTMSKYKFALAYENMSGAKGYVTEKIFDALQAKAVPIYWGASNILDYVDEDAFIDRRKFKNDEQLAKYLKGVTESQYNEMIAAGEKYLQTERCKKFSTEYFCNRIVEVLNLKNIK